MLEIKARRSAKNHKTDLSRSWERRKHADSAACFGWGFMMFNRLFSSLMMSLFCSVLLTALPARAQTLTVGVESSQYLPAYSYENGEYTGFARALLDAFAQDKGYRLEYKALPVVRLFSELLAGNIDLKFPDNAMWSASQKAGHDVVYSVPVIAYVDGVSVVPASKGMSVEAVRSLGLMRGFTAWDWRDRITAGTVSLHENNSFPALLETTIAGRNNGAYANVAVVNHQLERVLRKPGALVFDPGLPHTRSHYHLSSIKRPEVIAAFNAWMAANTDRVARMKAEFQVEKGVE
jgi:polar amino acid transport system substrate-binding protein